MMHRRADKKRDCDDWLKKPGYETAQQARAQFTSAAEKRSKRTTPMGGRGGSHK